jgi:glycosyltransferase involved in cell wall biosynthesis
MKVAIVWNYLFHYRIPLYRLLGQVPGVDLTVLHGGLVGSPGDARAGGPDDAFRSVAGTTRTWTLAGGVLYVQTGLLKALRRDCYDVIVFEGNFGILSNLPILLYGRFAGIPVLAWAAGWERGRITGLAALLRRLYIRMVARLPRGYICYGSGARDFLAKFGVLHSRCVIVQNTIDIEGIARRRGEFAAMGEQERRARGLTHKKIILAVGELRPQKDIAVLLEAFRTVRSARDDVALVVIGEGPERPRLEAITREHNVPDVSFLGSVVTDVGRYFAMSDIFVLPGDGGLAINEAMAHGLPVVCSTADGTEKDLVIDGHTGRFFKRGDAGELAARLAALLSSPDSIRVMGQAARDRVYGIASLSGAVERFAQVLGACVRREWPVSGRGEA